MTERPNKELALRYWSDLTLKAWYWSEANACWVPSPTPWFGSDRAWHVGHEAPTKPPTKMCELAGVKFPMPMREAPEMYSAYWEPNPMEPEHPNKYEWCNVSNQSVDLDNGFCQATSDGAIQQGRAMAAALQQAIEGAK